jgi:tol-pal system protein YbgF
MIVTSFKANARGDFSPGKFSLIKVVARRGKAGVFGAAALSTMLSACVVAAVPVEESASRGAAPTGVATAGAPAPAGVATARLSELYYQLQTLQQEVQDLRGLVEEQAHQLGRLRKDQKSQYLDLDRRMQGVAGAPRPATGGSTRTPRASRPDVTLSNSGSSSGANSETNSGTGQPQLRNGELYVPVPGTNTGTNTSGGGSTPAANPGAADANERKAYSDAIGLMKARQFDQSILAFNRLVVDYPGGSYNGHAFYWLGELYLAKGSDAKARQQFVQVIDLYPGHAKVPDALYKIGVVYHRQGDNDRALEYLNRVRGEYATSNAAKLATDYVKEMQ